MASSVVSRIKSKLTLLRRSSTSAASANSSPCLVVDDEIEGASARSSGSKQRNLLRRSVSYTLQPRPKSYMEKSSGKVAETMGAASSSTTALVGSDPMKLSQPESGIPGGHVSAEAAQASGITGSTGENTGETTAGLPSNSTAASTEGPAEKAKIQACLASTASVLGAVAQADPPTTAGCPSAPPNTTDCPSAPAPASPSSGPPSASSAPSTACTPTATPCGPGPSGPQVLHHQRQQLQNRLQRLAQDALHGDSSLLPSTSTHDPKNTNAVGPHTTSSALPSIYENVSSDPIRKLRPPPTQVDEFDESRAALLQHHHLTANIALPGQTQAQAPSPSSSPLATTPKAPTYTRNHVPSSSSVTATSSSSSAGPRPPSGSGPALRETSTPTAAHFVLDPAPEFAVPSPPAMTGTRKIWVRRPGASPTLITIGDEDLVDDVRETILNKYANSLGRTFDAPDLHLRLKPRDQKDRPLQPDEHMCRTLDNFYPGGQTINDAIIIDIPRRTPKASPHPQPHSHAQTAGTVYYTEDGRPLETGEGYFPPVGALPSSPHMQLAMPHNGERHGSTSQQPHSIAVLGTGHLPLIPSPGGQLRPRTHREATGRPRVGRTHTSSSGMNGSHGMHQQQRPRPPHSRTHSNSSDPAGMPPSAVPVVLASMPKSPGQQHVGVGGGAPSPRSSSARPKRRPKIVDMLGSNGSGVMTAIPPISVLIVEDNPINLKLLEAFVKRLKVRWQTATNGRDAVKKWRAGGFHLVLMDIQLPVMNGLEATREIRRLERINSIGVFSSVPSTPQEELAVELHDKDRLDNLHLFKGPVIIVALTASSLQSDRHEALAAGCNDFLTKPVNFVWLERKVMEWGCMQALIDFDGWRQWKDFALAEEEANQKTAAAKSKAKKARSSLASEV